jgi:nucleotide-binding universal stress UspA family protein
MSATGALLVIMVAWLVIGVVAATVMGRRGHHSFTWGALGAALGPLVVPLAWQDLRREREASPITLAEGAQGRGGVDVVIGVDGSPDARAALDAVVDMLGQRLGRCTLASVIDFDTALSPESWSEREHSEETLHLEAQRIRERTGREPTQMLLPGRPADALRDYARDSACSLLVVGSRGRGASKLVLGSVASELARGAPVPVFVVTAAGGQP